jgi:ribose/xylose/arabinose/galactoside ABC-type transport system permease subunit
MLAIAAVVIGGTPLKGGSGTIWGTLLGISLVLIIQDGLMLMGLPSPWQLAITGVILLFAVALQQVILMRTQRGQV